MRAVAAKPYDAITAIEFMRVWEIANRAVSASRPPQGMRTDPEIRWVTGDGHIHGRPTVFDMMEVAEAQIAEAPDFIWDKDERINHVPRVKALLAISGGSVPRMEKRLSEVVAVPAPYEPPPGWVLTCEKCGSPQGAACGWPSNCPTGVGKSAVTQEK